MYPPPPQQFIVLILIPFLHSLREALQAGFFLVQSRAILRTKSMLSLFVKFMGSRRNGSITTSLILPLWFCSTLAFTLATTCEVSPKLASAGCLPVKSSNNKTPYEYTSNFGVSSVPYPTSVTSSHP